MIFGKKMGHIGSVWKLESTRKRKKKKTKENDFLMFGFTMKNIKKIKYNHNSSKFYIFINFLVFI